MAIDTAAKRKSCIGIALIFLRLGVIPDGSNLSAPQRVHAEFQYSGIAAGAPVIASQVRRGPRAKGRARKRGRALISLFLAAGSWWAA